jgi:hypothetical protein
MLPFNLMVIVFMRIAYALMLSIIAGTGAIAIVPINAFKHRFFSKNNNLFFSACLCLQHNQIGALGRMMG